MSTGDILSFSKSKLKVINYDFVIEIFYSAILFDHRYSWDLMKNKIEAIKLAQPIIIKLKPAVTSSITKAEPLFENEYPEPKLLLKIL